MVKVIEATMLQIQADWAAENGPERFRDFMATLRCPRGSEAC